MRSVGHWQGVLRAWAALVFATAHLLLTLSIGITQAASLSLAHSLDGAICTPGGGAGLADAPAQPTHDHRGDCCVLCAGVGPIAAVPPALDAAVIHPITSGRADIADAAPFLDHRADGLPGSPRAPPCIV
jgi:hypothetical protein